MFPLSLKQFRCSPNWHVLFLTVADNNPQKVLVSVTTEYQLFYSWVLLYSVIIWSWAELSLHNNNNNESYGVYVVQNIVWCSCGTILSAPMHTHSTTLISTDYEQGLMEDKNSKRENQLVPPTPPTPPQKGTEKTNTKSSQTEKKKKWKKEKKLAQLLYITATSIIDRLCVHSQECFAMTKICLLWQNLCRNKIMFVATK